MQFAQWHRQIRRRGISGVMMMVITAAALWCVACNNEINIVAMADVNISEWSEPTTVTLKNEQPKSVGELTIVLHVNRRFNAKEVELEIVSTTADSLRYSEQITVSPTIEWPIPTAQSVDVEIPYRHMVEMRKVGQYSYTIRPLSPLHGVESVGMSYKTEKQ